MRTRIRWDVMFNLQALKTIIHNQPENPAMVIALLVIISFNLWIRHLRKKRKRDKIIALEKNHIIKAKLIKKSDNYDKDNNYTGTSGKYEYFVNGKVKHKWVNNTSLELTLYYVDSPNKVFSDFDNYNLGCMTSILLGIFVFILIMYLVGGPFYYLFK